MNMLPRHLGAYLLLILSLGLLACQEKASTKAPAEQARPMVVNPGMRAYVDPVTGQYAPAPPQAELPEPLVPAAGLVSPGDSTSKAKEIPLPGGGVMIELGDHFQTKDQAPK